VRIIETFNIPGGSIRVYKTPDGITATFAVKLNERGQSVRYTLNRMATTLEELAKSARALVVDLPKESELAVSSTTIKTSTKIDSNADRLVKFKGKLDSDINEYDAYQAELERNEQLAINKE
jgi:hypothetical protein